MSLFSIAPAMADRPTLPNCAVASLLLTLMTGCSTNAPRNAEDASAAPARLASDISLKHPSFSRSAVIYQINTRQFTAEGTFTAAAAELPRLKSLGADILWLMPIHPIGEKHRKGTLGSPYSVKDYLAVNPEFGTLSEFKAFVEAAHKLGLYVIVDWVANHTAWDNNLVDQHPDWYARNWQGDYRPTPWSDWSDIIDLDYTQPELRDYMLSAMKYWVAEVGVDGYRCDVASFVPTSFWNHVRRELDAIKPVFMLAEAQERDLHYAAFDAGYAWDWYNTIHAVASGQADANALRAYYAAHQGAYPADTMR
ncbi:MAG: alpha-amylase family glycosyl hydrolase, partial [Pseudomonadota bacterium]